MLKPHELESLRRSLAMSPSLPEPQIRALIETCDQLLTERLRIEIILRDLGPSWRGTRRALNDLAGVLRGSDAGRRSSIDTATGRAVATHDQGSARHDEQ